MTNRKIFEILQGFSVDGRAVPVAFKLYEGTERTYIVFSETDASAEYAEDGRQVIRRAVDFDVYTPGNYEPITDALTERLEAAGASLLLSQCSADLYEQDTGLYHKTMAYEFIEYAGK